MAKEIENVEIRPVSGGYIVAIRTSEETDEGYREWDTEEKVALTKEAALKEAKDALP